MWVVVRNHNMLSVAMSLLCTLVECVILCTTVMLAGYMDFFYRVISCSLLRWGDRLKVQ